MDGSSTADEGAMVGRSACNPPAGRAASGIFRWIGVPGLLLLAAVAALTVDVSLSAHFLRDGYPRLVREILENIEPFGHAAGIFLILSAVWALDPRRRAALPRILAASLGAGLAADVVKLTISRVRPRDFDIAAGQVAQTFGGWFSYHTALDAGHSFPSAHTASAVALAIVLSHYYSRGRAYFGALAALVALQRVQSGAHFLSDVAVGAALGWLVAHAMLFAPGVSGWFHRLEGGLADKVNEARAARSTVRSDAAPGATRAA